MRVLLLSIFVLLNAECFAMPETEWRRTEKQAAFIESECSNFLYVGGVGSGKSHAGGQWTILKRAIPYPKAVGLIAANTHKQLSQTTLKKLCNLLDSASIDYIYNRRPPAEWGIKSHFPEHEGVLTIRNGRQYICASLENFNALRGIELADAWLDETRDTDPDAISVIQGRFRGYSHIYPNMKYQLRITTTPNGYDHVWEKFVNPKTKLPDSGFVQSSTRDNIYDPTFYHRIISNYSKSLAAQEIEGEFVNLATGRAYTFSRDKNVFAVEYDPNLPLYWSMDFNIAPLVGVVMQLNPRTRTANVLDEVYIPESAQTAEACQEFVARWKDKKPNTLRLAGDASGGNRTTTTQETNHSIMIRETRPHFRYVEEAWDSCNPTQFSRVQATNALMEPAKGEPRLLIHPQCENLILDFERVAFKPGTQQLDKSDPLVGHISDAATYPIAKEFPIEDGVERARSFGRKGGFFG